MPSPPAPDGRDSVELVSWALLAAASIASAWCAYEASLWNGVQTKSLAQASLEQFASVRLTSNVNRNVSVDVGTYLSYVQADLRGDAKLATFLRTHARSEFRPALEAWIESRGRRDEVNPFVLPEYHLADQEKALHLDAQAASNIAAANAANNTGDLYVLHTVMFALCLSFLGATSEARRSRIRRAMLIIGVIAFLLAAASMLRLPRAAAPTLGPSARAALAPR